MLLGFMAFGEVIWLVFSFFRRRKDKVNKGSGSSIIEAGRSDGFIPNTVTAFPRGHFYLACLEDGGFLALHRRCTHLGCTVPWVEEEKQFICPCHSSAYDIRGEVVRSPAPRAMDIFPIRIENKTIYVDTRKIVKRTAFKPEQVCYP